LHEQNELTICSPCPKRFVQS